MRILLSLFILSVFLISCEDKKPVSTKKVTGLALDSLIKEYPDSIGLLLQRVEERNSKFLYNEALADAARAFRLDSSRSECRIAYGKALINNPKRTEADLFRSHKIFKKLVKKEPKNTLALVGLANTYTMFGDYENSFKYINKALRIDPKMRDAYNLKGTNYRLLGNFERTVSSYETAVQQDPKFYEGYLMLGSLYEFKEDPICIEYYTTAYKLQPKSADVLYSLAYAKQKFGKENDAKRLYRKMLKLDEKYYEAYFQQGFLFQFSEKEVNLDSALYFYDKTLELEPRHIQSYHNMGLIYEDQGEKSLALMMYAKALKIDPEFELTKERVEYLKKRL